MQNHTLPFPRLALGPEKIPWVRIAQIVTELLDFVVLEICSMRKPRGAGFNRVNDLKDLLLDANTRSFGNLHVC